MGARKTPRGRHFIERRRGRWATVAVLVVVAASLAVIVPSPPSGASDNGDAVMFVNDFPHTVFYGEQVVIDGTVQDGSLSCLGPAFDCDNPTGLVYVSSYFGGSEEILLGQAGVYPLEDTAEYSTFGPLNLNPAIPPGVVPINIVYQGNFRPLVLEDTITVLKDTCRVTLTQSSPVSNPGQSVTFTAKLSTIGQAPGQIEFSDDVGPLASVDLVGGQAAFSTSALPQGTTHVTASWAGTSTHDPCSTAVDHTVATDPPPFANDESAVTDINTPVVFDPMANDFDLGGGPIRIEFQDSPSDGDISDNPDGTFTYTPNADFIGEDDVHYVVYDSVGQSSNQADTHFVVGCLPSATPDSYDAQFQTTLTVGAPGVRGNDQGCDELATIARNPKHGKVILDGADGSFTYTPDVRWAGRDTFEYQYSDGPEGPAVATVTVTTASPPPPDSTTTTTTGSTTSTTVPGTTTTTVGGSTTTTGGSTTTTSGSTTTTTTAPTTTTTSGSTTTTAPTTTTTTSGSTTTTAPTTTSTTSTSAPPSTRPTTSTTTPPTVAPPAIPVTPTPTATDVVTALYRDLLGREPGEAAIAYWTAKLAAGTGQRGIAAALLGSSEYRRHVVTETYLMILGRPPSAGSLAFWAAKLRANPSLDDLRSYLLGSAELWTKVGGTADGFVDALYHQVLGRSPDDGGRAFLAGLLAGGTGRAGLARWLLGTDEAHRHLADLWYQALLDRAATADEAAHWVTALRAGTPAVSLIADILGRAGYPAVF